jgi:acyl-homoserine-lactone acylase
MKKLVLLFVCLSFVPLGAQRPASADAARWEQQAQNVTIVRDDWGIPHVYGKSDADAVFGVIYAQAEDDFNRVETNYLTSLGGSPRRKGSRRSTRTCG